MNLINGINNWMDPKIHPISYHLGHLLIDATITYSVTYIVLGAAPVYPVMWLVTSDAVKRIFLSQVDGFLQKTASSFVLDGIRKIVLDHQQVEIPSIFTTKGFFIFFTKEVLFFFVSPSDSMLRDFLESRNKLSEENDENLANCPS